MFHVIHRWPFARHLKVKRYGIRLTMTGAQYDARKLNYSQIIGMSSAFETNMHFTIAFHCNCDDLVKCVY